MARRRPDDDTPIWAPSRDRREQAQMTRFASAARERWGVDVRTSAELHGWSVRSPEQFWETLWYFADVVGTPGDTVIDRTSDFHRTQFFPDGDIDVAATILRGDDHDVVVRSHGEGREARHVERGALRHDVAAVADRLRHLGVGPGNVVAAWATNGPGILVTMLATLAVGATFTSSSIEFGPAAVVARFGQVGPTVLLVTPAYRYGGTTHHLGDRLDDVVAALPTLRLVIVDDTGADADDAAERAHAPADASPAPPVERLGAITSATSELVTTRVPFNAPGWILYSSGTTGPPKCIVHRAGGVLLKHLSEHLLHCDIRQGDRVFYYTTPGWMMWNWLTSALATGAAIVLYDGSPIAPDPDVLLRLADEERITYFGTSPGYLETLRQRGATPRHFRLDALRTIGVTGAPLAPRTARFAAGWADDVHVLSKSGGTDLCGGLVTGDPTSPVWAGEIQMAALGVDIAIVDDDGNDVAVGETGELVSRNAFPSMPLRFLDDPDDARLRATYYDRFPGCWHQSDFASTTPHGGFVIHGRSDTTLNANGVRIGTAEIYAELAHVPGIRGAAAVGHEHDGTTRIVLVLDLDDDVDLDPEFEGDIRARLRNNCSPRHVPALIVHAPQLPLTTNGKVSEVAVADALNGRPVRGLDALANPESIDEIQQAARPSLIDLIDLIDPPS